MDLQKKEKIGKHIPFHFVAKNMFMCYLILNIVDYLNTKRSFCNESGDDINIMNHLSPFYGKLTSDWSLVLDVYLKKLHVKITVTLSFFQEDDDLEFGFRVTHVKLL